jgi:hypothetical protein
MPSTVGTSTVATAFSYPPQRKSFYANGRFWVFYSDGTNLVYRTSTDGENWSNATTIGACDSGDKASVFFDGTYVHYMRYAGYTNYYRRGIPNSDGSITWSANEQQITGSDWQSACLVVDSNGYAWVGYRKYVSGWFPWVSKNSKKDGTWSTEFSYQLSTTASASWRVCPVPLTNGKMYVIYCYPNALPRGRLYDGSWGSEETDLADYNIQDAYAYSAVAEGDNVHFVYNRYSTYQIRYNKRVYGSGWQTNDVLVQDSMESTSAPALSIDTSTSNLYCFWAKTGTDHVYYKKCLNGTWESTATDWIDESTDTIQYGYVLNSFYKAYNSYIALVYVTKSASPYNVKFALLTLALAPTVTVEDSVILSDFGLFNKTLTVPDFLVISDAPSTNKQFSISDSFGLSDAALVNKQFSINDAVTLSEFVEALKGAIVKSVADQIGLADIAVAMKKFQVSDSVSLLDAAQTPTRIIKALEETRLTDTAWLNKTLIITDQIALVEVVEKTFPKAVKTKLFLIVGDLAIQLT